MLGVALRFQKPFTKVDQMTLGLKFTAATPVGIGDAHRRKRIVAGDDDVIGDEISVLEREDVQRSLEFMSGEQQWHGQAPTQPLGRERDRACEIIKRHPLDQAERPHVALVDVSRSETVGDERVEPRAEDRPEVPEQRLECRALAVGQRLLR